MLSLGVLCSGGLGFETLKKIQQKYVVKFILTDKKSTDIILFAEEKQITCFAGNPRDGIGYQEIKDIEVDVIASINYLFLIEEDIIAHPKKLIFNIHGSLLPKYRGRTPHVWAIINGEKEAGITAHEVDKGCDTGKIIHQIKVPIEEHDTGVIMLKKYELLYFPLVEKVLMDVQNDQLSIREQDHEKATYFGKRTPADGLIDWNLSKEQIRNWVRAQAYPYPGAFSFYQGEKVTIDKVSYVDLPSFKNYENGQIISVEGKPVVKTENGALELTRIREEKVIFKAGNRLNNEHRK